MRVYLLTTVFFFCLNCVHSQAYLVEADKIATIPKSSLNQIPGVIPLYDVDVYYILYNTVNTEGQPTQASGAFMVPVTDSCNYFPYVSFQHGTVLRKNDVPSRNNSEAIVGHYFATLGYVVSMPDYLGLGDNGGLHPYVHAESEATATIDLIRACREYMQDSLVISDNGQVFLAGYSQGGHATMAVHKYIEENNLTTEFNVVASAPGAGPYHLSGAQADMVFLNPAYTRQGYIIYLLFAFNEVYKDLFTLPSEVLKSPYDSTIPPLLNGSYNMSQLNNALPDSLHEYLQDSVYQLIMSHYSKSHPIWDHLAENDNYNWKPDAPVRMLYCQGDEQVSHLNSVNALQAMQALGANNVEAINLNTSGTHGSCSGPALMAMFSWFGSLMTPCTQPSSVEQKDRDMFCITPNPASDELVLKGIIPAEKLIIYNLQGQKLLQFELNKADTYCKIDISGLSAGLYVLRFIDTNKTMHFHKLVKE